MKITNSKNNYILIIVLALLILILVLAVFILIFKGEYNYMISLVGIISGMFIAIFAPYFNKNVELDKYKMQIIIENKKHPYSSIIWILGEIKRIIEDILMDCFVENMTPEERSSLFKAIVLNKMTECEDKFDKLREIISENSAFISKNMLDFFENRIKIFKERFFEELDGDLFFILNIDGSSKYKTTEEDFAFLKTELESLIKQLEDIINLARKELGVDQ